MLKEIMLPGGEIKLGKMGSKICCVICNGNRTEWSTIQGVIGRVISNRPSA